MHIKAELSCTILMACALLLSACDRRSDEVSHASSFGQRIINADAEPQNWLSHGRNYEETRHSPLDQINTSNVGSLGLAWFYDLDTNRGQESTPIIVDGVVYTSSAWSKVQAFDGTSGRLLWQFDPKVPGEAAAKGCCDVVNRGVAFWNDKVYVGTIDGRLIAIDAGTGREVWSTITVDQTKNYTITGAPRIVKGKVIIGNGGAEYGVRGYVSAYDAGSGKLVWRFYTVPGKPGQRDGAASDAVMSMVEKTWAGEPGGGGGGTVWDSMAYDPELDLLYVGVGNGSFWSPAYRGRAQGANNDNLFVGSVLALRPDTGEYVWHYQETPGDQWDYTSTQHMILADLSLDGQMRKVLMHAPKNGFFYVLDRTNGRVLSARPYAAVNWATAIDLQTGRPILNPAADYSTTGKRWMGLPGSVGAHNWPPMAFNPATGLVYIPTTESPQLYELDRTFKPLPKGVNTGIDLGSIRLPYDAKALAGMRASLKASLLAWDPVNQKEAWRAPMPGGWSSGVLSTTGGLVLTGNLDGQFSAFDAASGKQLWTFDARSAILAAPVTWAKDNVQYITVVAGMGGSAGLGSGAMSWSDKGPRPNRSRVLTFALGKNAALPRVEPTVAQRSPPRVEQLADAKTVERGRTAYHRTCFACHGFEALSAGIVPDLRYSQAITDKNAWTAIVADGVLSQRGMVGFKENFSLDEIEAIRAYVIDRARANAAL
ncbi:MAG: PQQ-dependent dehydrogenase, methanol/ethanol family [Steroidobacteraceae bacterium]